MANNLFQTFQQMLTTHADLRLMNVYKGVPIAHEASLTQVGNISILVKSTAYQVVCMYHERETFLQSPNLENILRARVVYLDAGQLQAELAEFVPQPAGIGDRKQVRVSPEQILKGGVFTSGMGEPFQAELADVSREGLAIYIPKTNFYSTVYRKGVKIAIKLRFPGEYEVPHVQAQDDSSAKRDPLARFNRDTLQVTSALGPSKKTTGSLSLHKVRYPEVEVRGLIANLREETEFQRYRVGIQILPGDASQPTIQTFISQRHAEIIREMQKIYTVLAPGSG